MPPYLVVPMPLYDNPNTLVKLVLPVDALRHVEHQAWRFMPSVADALPDDPKALPNMTLRTLLNIYGTPYRSQAGDWWDFRNCPRTREDMSKADRTAQDMATKLDLNIHKTT